jgi:hypothetical protein
MAWAWSPGCCVGELHGGELGASRGSIKVVFLARWFTGMWTAKLAGSGGVPARRSGDELHGGELGMAWRASLGMEREKRVQTLL